MIACRPFNRMLYASTYNHQSAQQIIPTLSLDRFVDLFLSRISTLCADYSSSPFLITIAEVHETLVNVKRGRRLSVVSLTRKHLISNSIARFSSSSVSVSGFHCIFHLNDVFVFWSRFLPPTYTLTRNL